MKVYKAKRAVCRLTMGALGAEGNMKAAEAWKQARAPTSATVVLIFNRGGVCGTKNQEGKQRKRRSALSSAPSDRRLASVPVPGRTEHPAGHAPTPWNSINHFRRRIRATGITNGWGTNSETRPRGLSWRRHPQPTYTPRVHRTRRLHPHGANRVLNEARAKVL